MPTDFKTTKRLTKEYEQAIRRHVTRVLPPKLPEQSFDQWIASIADLSRRYDAQEAASTLASRMVSLVSAGNARTWRTAAQRTQRSSYLYRMLRGEMQGSVGSRITRLTRENASYISGLPQEAAEQLQREIQRAQQAGARPETVARLARLRFPQLLKSKINLIARTESAKASTVLTQARSEELGVDFYIWLTSEDARVRLSHRRMNGVVIPWSQPPNPELLAGESAGLGHYHAGEAPNCRCTQDVVLTLDDIKFPARVYWQGAIKRLTRAQFQQMAHLERRVA